MKSPSPGPVHQMANAIRVLAVDSADGVNVADSADVVDAHPGITQRRVCDAVKGLLQ